ncbi:sigma-70 family RNA polymerase sigma factor [Amycolatopsis pithecellobii]|uniref:Sigma-70 family RNA polymerase sigma factor n=1 Tax=Amycolatopsis pithecellobii TaxID=664692 RepID=A0A6N7YPQ7_9PSEU|nr:sigma-70 family RNA polymerase sigma factor [Amycolatopsis pithecellobii]MTD54985.1 sigma-70 family RNA polymerase sigma factor [Amycolatopsis pithecellobii]
MSTVPADFDEKSDAELIAAVRNGNLAAYGTLYERHVGAAYNLARQLARSKAESDDLVSDAFAKVLDTLRAGKGPDSAFRAYLLTALRHTAYDKTRKDKRLDLNDDMTTLSGAGGAATEALTVPFSDTAVAGLERTMAAKAFARLPERWQAVLWHTEIEGQTPAEVAPLLGLTANGVSALAYRAREGLRQAYLQVHLAETSAERCRATADRLGAWTRDGLSKRERAQVEAHLDECDRCRALAAELADVNGALRAVVAPMVLGGAVFAYLAASGAKATAATATVAAASAGSAGGAASVAAAGPRQFLGVAASGVAIAAAVAVALAAGGGNQEIPAAAAVPAPPAAVAPPPAPAPAPAPPHAAPAPPPAAPPVAPPPAPVVPAPPVAPAPAPAPAPAKLSAQAPAEGIELEPGSGTPVELPITVRNDGGSVSDPVSASLNLPPGVRAVGPGGGGGTVAARGFTPQAAEPASGPISVDCPPGSGTVTCSTSSGLQPGETAVLKFRLLADPGAQPGEVTGTVMAGSAIRVSISVPVRVTPLPADGVGLAVEANWNSPWPWVGPAWLSVDVTNTGQSTKPATVTVDQPAHVVLGSFHANCAPGGTSPCTSDKPLAPGEHLRLWFVADRFDHDETITVTATIGTATQSQMVQRGCWSWGAPFCRPAVPPAPLPLPTTTTTTSEPPSSTSSTSSSPSTPTTTATTSSSEPATTTTTNSKPEKPGRPWWWLPWIPR